MKYVYACLIGEWVNLSTDDTVKIGEDRVSADQWLKENPEVFSPYKRDRYNNYEYLDYVNIEYQGKNYRINPVFIQIVTY